jgi:hypothetical protein
MLWLQLCKKTTYLQTFLYRLAVKWLWIASRRWGTLSGLAACARLASTRRVNQGKLYWYMGSMAAKSAGAAAVMS